MCVIKTEVMTWRATLTAEVALVDDTLTLIRQSLWLSRSIVRVTYLTDVVTVPGLCQEHLQAVLKAKLCLLIVLLLCFRLGWPISDQYIHYQQISPNMISI